MEVNIQLYIKALNIRSYLVNYNHVASFLEMLIRDLYCLKVRFLRIAVKLKLKYLVMT